MATILEIKEQILLCLIHRGDCIDSEPIVVSEDDNQVFRAELEAQILAGRDLDSDRKPIIKGYSIVKSITGFYCGHKIRNVTPIILIPPTYFGNVSSVSDIEKKHGFSQFNHAAENYYR